MKLSISAPAIQRIGFFLLSMELVALMAVLPLQMNTQKNAWEQTEAHRIYWCGNYVPENALVTRPIAWCGNYILNQYDQCYLVQKEAGSQLWAIRGCPGQ